jgi:leucyl-tRNA synthetase
MKYDPKDIEATWQKKWEKEGIYKTTETSDKPKFYVLDMFPYPSGEGLHVGHPKGYIATDVVSRMKRMQGFNVLHPMGFDAFGLPAEQYAIKMKTNPAVAVAKNVARYKKQLEILGFDYDWSREVNTTDPKYYKWTQWIFLKLLEKGLAEERFEPINWCPVDKTGLANEDVENGKCERCGATIEKRLMRQWVLKITDYADRLLADLDATDDYVMPELMDEKNPHQEGVPVVERKVAHAIVFDPKNKKYLIIRNKKHGWDTTIIGGIEGNETPVETAIREVREETGYTDIEFKRVLGGSTKASYYTKHKGENRVAYATAVYFELKSDARIAIADGEDADDEVLWIDEADFVPGKMVNSEMHIWLERIRDPKAGWPKPLLDWPESIKESQRNWIGRSEGSEIDFKLNSGHKVTVFTTRADTLFGVTYVVLAPEHSMIKELLEKVSNKKEVETYIATAKTKTEIDRTDTTREKTGVMLEGVTALNPANDEEVPVWVADYVLADYGTGAVMAVPAHDERDFDFAKKYDLPIKHVVAPYFEDFTAECKPRADKPTKKRKAVVALVKHWSEKKYLGLQWKKLEWRTLVTGGIEGDESVEETVKRELLEETGYDHVKSVTVFSQPAVSYFWAPHKDVNMMREGTFVLVELEDGHQQDITPEEKEKHEGVWVEHDKMIEFLDYRGAEYDVSDAKFFINEVLPSSKAFAQEGMLINSGPFTDVRSSEAKKNITEYVGGRWVVKYKLKDWVFSRQRYWGEPIPVLHDENGKVIPLSEDDLPLELPKVEQYEPTDNGESPLANISEWVNIDIEGYQFKRETNTMPQWAGSSWYYLRYMDPDNDEMLVDPVREKYWNAVDLYVGGAEHATRHLIYARFWHKFLYDIGVVSTLEPFTKLQSVGLIMAEDGRKMSKRWGNTVNPDEVVETFGADSMRLYSMFMGPFDQTISWSTNGVVGTRRFVEKVWRLGEKVRAEDLPGSPQPSVALLHKTIKKVTEDIEALKFNTAVSALMILVNEMEKEDYIPRDRFEILLKLLAPFAPHVAEELWREQGNKQSIHTSPWPSYDPLQAVEDTVKIAIQINGKTREIAEMEVDMSEEALQQAVEALPGVQKWVGGKAIKRAIVVQNKLINLLVDL